MLINKINALLDEIHQVLKEQSPKSKLPKNTYFLNNGDILCTERSCGESRFPYPCDGYILWAHSTGHIHAKNGLFNVFKPLYDSTEPAVEFFAGVENEDGTYFPISILGAAKQLFEPFKVERYLVYSLSCAYYIADTPFATFAVRTDMSRNKEIRFSFACINKSSEPLKICFTSYFNALLKEGEYDNMWTMGERNAYRTEDGAFVLSRESSDYHCLVINKKVSGAKVLSSEYTTSPEQFSGSARCLLSAAKCLKTGTFENDVLCGTAGIAAEILKLKIDGAARIDYVLPVTNKKGEVGSLIYSDIDSALIDKEIEEFGASEKIRLKNLDIKFNDFDGGKINENVMNRFIETVQKQVDNCAMGRYYVEDLLGIRDVFQQLEQALLWDPKQAREKILRALSFIDPSGRAPRQFSIPESKDIVPKMDLREFVDQGNWIISCVYSYLAWTNDYSILDEVIGYYEIIEDKTVILSSQKDTCLEHLIKIADYLESKLDYEDGTNCLRILYGDWNDAIDGLGKTKDPGKKYGTGVSVMASLHFYQNLFEISEILKKRGGYEDKINHYLKTRDVLKDGIVKNAVETNENGKMRLLHGWGDHQSYRVGSFKDSDGVSRISFAPNAFWASSGLIRETPQLKQLIIDTLHSLDSRFGIKTLTPAFTPDSPGVGRIANIPIGTAENDCVYIHASMFSIIALFILGDSEYAWQQLEKTVPINHKEMTKSPFVMSNSYLDNPEKGLNGQSSIDWYTGSGTVLIKSILRYGIGINTNLDGVVIQTAAKMPCSSLSVNLSLKGFKVHFTYKNENAGNRTIYFDGKALDTEFDELAETKKAFIETEKLHDGAEITVCD